ncbi:MAG: 1,4-beta-xylanase [Luteolibacter sp.]
MKHVSQATMKSILSLAILSLAVPHTVRAEPRAGADTQAGTAIAGRWTVERINQWQQRHGWLVGCNYLPATAINQHEMWSAKTWDPATIARELDLARDTGFNTLRVYLHDRTHAEDPAGLLNRMDEFLKMSSTRGIKPMFVFFDACWLPPNKMPTLIPEPRPGTHNSGWLQSPGYDLVQGYASDPRLQERLKSYVQAVLRKFAADSRVRCWDLFNEPGNAAHLRFNDQGGENPGEHRAPFTFDGDLALLKDVFRWARDVAPSQPLTSGVWKWERAEDHPIARTQLENSDIISFHSYSALGRMKKSVQTLRAGAGGRPLLCTEYMARHTGSTFEDILPFLAAENIGAINWGFVDGKSQTRYSWGSWRKPESPDAQWFHDIYQRDGKPYRPGEVELIRRISREKNNPK